MLHLAGLQNVLTQFFFSHMCDHANKHGCRSQCFAHLLLEQNYGLWVFSFRLILVLHLKFRSHKFIECDLPSFHKVFMFIDSFLKVGRVVWLNQDFLALSKMLDFFVYRGLVITQLFSVSFTIRWENKAVVAIVNVFAVAIWIVAAQYNFRVLPIRCFVFFKGYKFPNYIGSSL